MKRRPRPEDSRQPVGKFPLGTVVRYPDRRTVMLTADICGGRMGRPVVDGVVGELSGDTWIEPTATVELVAAYEPKRLDNQNTETDPLIAGRSEP